MAHVACRTCTVHVARKCCTLSAALLRESQEALGRLVEAALRGLVACCMLHAVTWPCCSLHPAHCMLRDSVPTEDEVGQLAVAHGATVARSGHGLPRRGRGPDPQRELPNPTTPGRTATCVIHDTACRDALTTACTTQRPPSECRKLPTSRQRTAPCISPQQFARKLPPAARKQNVGADTSAWMRKAPCSSAAGPAAAAAEWRVCARHGCRRAPTATMPRAASFPLTCMQSSRR